MAGFDSQEITSLMGLGEKSQAMLRKAEIESVQQLLAIGLVEAFLRVKRSGGKPSLNLLWALEGAITGESWRTVARQRRLELLVALEDAEKQSTQK